MGICYGLRYQICWDKSWTLLALMESYQAKRSPGVKGLASSDIYSTKQPNVQGREGGC